MADLVHIGAARPTDWNDLSVPGARATFYLTGTATAATVYQDRAATVAHASPVVADGTGAFPAIYALADVDVEVRTADGDLLPGYPRQAVRSAASPGSAGGISFEPTTAVPETTVQDAIERVQENLEGLGSTGMLVRRTGGNIVGRTLQGTADLLTITNANGSAGDPVIAPVVASQASAEAGSGAGLMTPQRVEQHMQYNALGWGQTWQDVSGARVLGTSYQNSTTRPIMVAIAGFGGTAGAGQAIFQVSADGSSWVPVAWNSDTAIETFAVVVPVGWYYRTQALTTLSSPGGWSELR